jgi:hypothetical protein
MPDQQLKALIEVITRSMGQNQQSDTTGGAARGSWALVEEPLDESLVETFPASDPAAV